MNTNKPYNCTTSLFSIQFVPILLLQPKFYQKYDVTELFKIFFKTNFSTAFLKF